MGQEVPEAQAKTWLGFVFTERTSRFLSPRSEAFMIEKGLFR